MLHSRRSKPLFIAFKLINTRSSNLSSNTMSTKKSMASSDISSSNLNPHTHTKTRPPIVALLIDVSGNLHVGSTPTPGAVDAFQRLVESKIPFRLCSNTSKESTGDLIKRLDSMGFRISKEARALSRSSNQGAITGDTQDVVGEGGGQEDKYCGRRLVWTSIGAAAQAVKDMGLKTPYLLLSDSARVEIIEALPPSNETETAGLSNRRNQDTNYDSIVIGLAPSVFDYEHLNVAFRILKGEMHEVADRTDKPARMRIPIIATHRAKYIQSSSGQLSLGPGPFIAALECAAGPGVQTHVVGKPTKAFFGMVIRDFGLDEVPGRLREQNVDESGRSGAGKIAVIGDDVETDLGGGAIELGLWRVLVNTGKYRPGDEAREGVVPPDEVCDSFAAFVDRLLSEKER